MLSVLQTLLLSENIECMDKLLYILIAISVLMSCSKDDSKKDMDNPYSKKRPTKIIYIEDEGDEQYIYNYNFFYDGNKLIQIKLSVNSSDYTYIYNQDYNYRYSRDTIIMTTKDEGGAENYSYEHKYLIDENRMATYTKRGTKYRSPNGEMTWSSSSDVFLLKSGRIEEYIETESWGDRKTTRFIYTGDKLTQKITKEYGGNTENISYKYDGELVYVSYNSEPYDKIATIKDGKLFYAWENSKISYTSDGLIKEIILGGKRISYNGDVTYTTDKINYFYENGNANLEFLKLDLGEHFDFTLDPLFSFFYW